jgi:hypothetical protein
MTILFKSSVQLLVTVILNTDKDPLDISCESFVQIIPSKSILLPSVLSIVILGTKGSIVQTEEHLSPLIRFPSSHVSNTQSSFGD